MFPTAAIAPAIIAAIDDVDRFRHAHQLEAYLGLVPREEDGPILEEGRRYTFEVDAAWEDLEGRPIVAAMDAAGFDAKISN